MGFDVGNFRRAHASRCLGEGDDLCLRVKTWCGETDFVRAIVVNGPALDHRENGISVCDCFTEAFQQNNAATVTEYGSGSLGIECSAGAIRRHHAFFLKEILALLWKGDRDSTGKRHVALIGQQSGSGLADCDE